MPRTGRVVLPDYPHHVVQRGHNRQVVFAEPADYCYYLGTLAEFKAAFGVHVYAFCLMTNHVHLLLAPDTRAGLGQLMKRLAGRQTRYHNCAEGRRGTLWESRYKSSRSRPTATCWPDSLIELNPVRARMEVAPESIRVHASRRYARRPTPCGAWSAPARSVRGEITQLLTMRSRPFPCGGDTRRRVAGTDSEAYDAGN